MRLLFGRLVPLMNQVGEGGGAAGSGSPSGTPPAGANGQQAAGGDAGGQGSGTPPAGNGQANGQPPAAKTFTQDEVNRIAANAREEGRQRALKEPHKSGGEGAEGQKAAAAGAQASMTAEQIAEIAAKAAASVVAQHSNAQSFREEARRLGYSDDQAKLAEAAHGVEKPQGDTATWLKQFAEKNRLQTTPPGTNERGVAAAPYVPRKLDEMRDSAGLIDVFSLPPEEVQRLGPQRLRAEFEKVLAAGSASSGAPPVPSYQRSTK